MRRSIFTFALVALLSAGMPGAGAADTDLTGVTDGGAFFKIVVPDAWNGDLVIQNHGFSLSPIGPVGDLGALAQLQLSEGYAVAASSYQQIGWALFKTKNDNQNMLGVFKANFGEPNNVIVGGGSLGGIVTAQAIEKANLGNVVGAYPICGAMAGSRNWDGALDVRLIYDAVCADVPTSFIPGGPTGLPAPGFPDYPYSNFQMALAVNECMGILTPPPFRTPSQVAHLNTFLAATQLPESFVLTVVGYGVFAMSNVIFDPAKLDGQQGLGNMGVTYPDPLIDAAIERVAANPGAANRLKKNFTPKGNVGDTKIVSIHTSGDGLVIVENEKEYQDVVPASNLTVAIVNEAPAATHCGFSGAETVAGWESLRGWVAGAPQPTVESIQATCLALMPSFGGPCRYDPSFVIPDMDGRILPR
jgi:hypothetical protein